MKKPLDRQTARQLVAESLKRQRQALGLSVADVALDNGISVGALFDWERGRHEIAAGPFHHLMTYYREARAQRKGQKNAEANAGDIATPEVV